MVAASLIYLRQMGKKINQPAKIGEDANSKVELKKAQIRAQKLLEEASIKAKEIIYGAQVVREDQEKKMDEVLGKSVEIYAKRFQEMIVAVQSEADKVLSGVPEAIEDSVATEMGVFKSALQEELAKFQEEAKTILQDVYRNANQRVQNEIDNYKGWRLKQIDNSILAIIEEVSKKVLAKEINAEEHEKLVARALEEAKRQNMF
ncbi:MAG: hypothetical protein ACXADB_00955 [Candidatus Hermodarchaeia archaeon]